MTSGEQFSLDLTWPPGLAEAEFMVAPANQEAVAWVNRWPAWPASALLLHGPCGSGKTHLGHVWLKRTNARLVNVLTLDPLVAMETGASGRPLLVDDASRVANHPAREEGLLHLYNLTRETGGTVLLTARQPAAHWGLHLPDLASRLNALPLAAIAGPDDTLLTGVIRKQAADRGLGLSPTLVAFLLPRMERSFDGARRLVDALDRATLATGRPPGISLATAILAGMEKE